MSIDAVIFDWGGTLTPWLPVDLRGQWEAYATAALAAPGQDSGGAAELTDRLFAAEEAGWAVARTEHRSTTLERIFAQAQVDTETAGHQQGLAAYRQFWEAHTHTDPQVAQLWDALRSRGIAVGVLSNTIWSRQYHREIFDRDGVIDLITGDVYSSEIDYAKPHPEAFRAACAAVGTAPEDSVYVGDRLFEDIYGPQQIGMKAIWIPHSDIPDNQLVATEAVPDAEAHELLDIIPIVDRWSDD